MPQVTRKGLRPGSKPLSCERAAQRYVLRCGRLCVPEDQCPMGHTVRIITGTSQSATQHSGYAPRLISADTLFHLILSQMNLVHTKISYFLTYVLIIVSHISIGFPSNILTFRFPDQTCVRISHLLCLLHAASLICLDLINIVVMAVKWKCMHLIANRCSSFCVLIIP